jgi:hypothetical protein
MSHLDMGIGGVTPLPVFDPLRERQPSCLITELYGPSLAARTHRPQTQANSVSSLGRCAAPSAS